MSSSPTAYLFSTQQPPLTLKLLLNCGLFFIPTPFLSALDPHVAQCRKTGQPISCKLQSSEFHCWAEEAMYSSSSSSWSQPSILSHDNISAPQYWGVTFAIRLWFYFLCPLFWLHPRECRKINKNWFWKARKDGWNSREEPGGDRDRELRDPQRNMHVLAQLKVTNMNLQQQIIKCLGLSDTEVMAAVPSKSC